MTRDEIVKRRKALGLSQKTLADQIHATQAHVSGIETGKRGVSIELLDRIAMALGCSINDLLGKDVAKENPIRIEQNSASLIEKYKQENDLKFQAALEQLSDPEKLAIVLMLKNMDKEQVRKAFDFLSDQQLISEMKKAKGA